MTPSGLSICLSMIVKDEAPVIRRCLAAVRPLIDHWIIVDTGSADGTQEIVREALADCPGCLIERPWRDFGHNRSEALALARPHGTYSLVVDADDEFLVPAGFVLPELDADCYLVDIEDGPIAYQRTQLMRAALPWRYAGVLHEFPTCDRPVSTGHLPIRMRRNHDGARRRAADTYRRDAALLEAALRTETDPFLRSRYRFYLAQSYRDCGERDRALTAYLERAELGFWQEEVYVSLAAAAALMAQLGRPDDEVIATYGRATAICPARVEARHGASRHCRLKGRYEEGFRMAEPGLGLTAPSGGLFVEPWIYDYGLRDEYAVNAYWSGRHRACLSACLDLLARPHLPEADRDRFASNARHALSKLADEPPEASWLPERPQGGTEIMAEGLRRRLGDALEAIDLRINLYDPASLRGRPLVVWIHHDIDQAAVAWLDDPARVAAVDRFVFVSEWQRARFLDRFSLPPDLCIVLRNATEVPGGNRPRRCGGLVRVAYTSVPYRGLSVLLDAWDMLRPPEAELHVWSSHKLYGPTADDAPYQALYDRAATLPGVRYHGLLPNAELRAALAGIDILAYPSTFAETSCLAVIEAMAAGCRVVCPALGALPETTGGFARLYPVIADAKAHARIFAEILAEEIASPWGGFPALSETQREASRRLYDWTRRAEDWRALVGRLEAESSPLATADDRVRRALERLRDDGFQPSGVIDVGAHDGQFSSLARSVFPDAHILMIDALAEKETVFARMGAALGNATDMIALVGESEGEMAPFFVVDTQARPDLVTTGASTFRENSGFPIVERTIPQRRLDTILEGLGRRFALIKLDVQGAELAVLRSLGPRLAEVEVIVMELSLVAYNDGAPLLDAVIAELRALGFVLHDVVEEHRYRDGNLLQIDGVFLRPASPLRANPPFWT